jgi:hypothetical protein
VLQTGFMTGKVRQPPEPLGTQGERLWASIVSLYELSPGENWTLFQACKTSDLIAALEDELYDGPATVTGASGQVKAHPLIAAVTEQRRLLDKLLLSLSLPMPDEAAGRRRSPQAHAAAQARWRQRRTDREVHGG